MEHVAIISTEKGFKVIGPFASERSAELWVENYVAELYDSWVLPLDDPASWKEGLPVLI